MQLVSLLFFIFFVALLSLLPFPLIYKLADFTSWVLRRLFSYRKQVIQDNLKMIFPDLTALEIQQLTKKTYRNLADNLVESVKSFSMRKASIIKRYKIVNPELLNPYYQKNQSIIGVTGHYGNWEWGSIAASLQSPYKFAAFYKPIRNKYLDKFIKKSRSKCGTELISIYQTTEAFETRKGQAIMFLMAADQSPSGKQLKHAFWINFLGKETAFLHGVEKHARINNYPVVYTDIQRIKRGYYEVTLSVICEHPNELAEGEITQRYAQKLEAVICKKPENWLWSHKRWKHQKK
jgi:KDO2-lipid IV(A) lauroyltransferase